MGSLFRWRTFRVILIISRRIWMGFCKCAVGLTPQFDGTGMRLVCVGLSNTPPPSLISQASLNESCLLNHPIMSTSVNMGDNEMGTREVIVTALTSHRGGRGDFARKAYVGNTANKGRKWYTLLVYIQTLVSVNARI